MSPDVEAAVRRIMEVVETYAQTRGAVFKRRAEAAVRNELSRVPAALPKCPRHGVYMCLACMKGAVPTPAEPAQQDGKPIAKIHSDGYWTRMNDWKEPVNFYSVEVYAATPQTSPAQQAITITPEERGAIAYQLTKKLVIDMPTARAAVDAAIEQSRAKGVKP